MRLNPRRPLGMRLLLALLIALFGTSPARANDTQSPGVLADQMVRNFRELVLLHASEKGRLSRERTAAGQHLFYQTRLLAARLVDDTSTDPALCAALMDHLQGATEWRDVDRLALGGVMAELDSRLAPDQPCGSRIRVERAALASIRAFYNREISAILRVPGGAPGATGPAWNDYLAFLKRRQDFGAVLTAPDDATAPRAATSGERSRMVGEGARDEWTDGDLPSKTILLTFDDGPHPTYTPRVLDILKRYSIKAVFFLIGQNVGTQHGTTPPFIREPALIRRMLDEGHSIANHTYTHALLPRLGEVEMSGEIDRTEQLLTLAAGEHPGRARLFRPPYGARNDLVLSDVSQRGLRTVIWNIDSRDWADPIPHSIAQRVLDEAAREGRGIVLFHDIHQRSVEALQPAIEGLLKHGFRFARHVKGRLTLEQD